MGCNIRGSAVMALALLSGCSVITETDDEVVDVMWCVGACIHASKQTEDKRQESVGERAETTEVEPK